MKKYVLLKIGIIAFLVLFIQQVQAQTVIVNSLEDLLPYLDDDNADVKLAPGTYNISAIDITQGKFSNPLLLFEGSNSTYDFTDVTINVHTFVFQKFGSVDVKEIQILGNNNVLKNLTLADTGDYRPSKTAQNITMDGRDNRIEGFHLSTRGSYPYGYGDAFGKGGANTVIGHKKHSAILIRGLRNHLKNTTVISRTYGHCVFMQAASYPTIEGCYIEGEVRTTDDMLAEAGTGSPADNVNFMTTWGYTLPAGYMMSLQEAGIRAYNAGTTYIDGVEIKRGTDNPTVLNCTIKNTRTGVTLAHATGTKHVEGVSVIGCEQGYSIGSGTVSNCSGDAQYGPLLTFAYSSDKNTNIDVTFLPTDNYYNGSATVAYIGGHSHNITLRGGDPDATNLSIQVGGEKNNIRLLGVTSSQNPLSASNLELNNLTEFPVVLDAMSTNVTGESCGTVTDNGSGNLLLPCVVNSEFPDPNKTYYLGNNRFVAYAAANGGDEAYSIPYGNPLPGVDGQWVFTPVTGRTGYYYIDCLGGGAKPRLTAATASGLPQMEPTTETGASAQWSVVQPVGRTTYHITNDYARLLGLNAGENQIILAGTTNTSNQSRFAIIEASTLSTVTNEFEDIITIYPIPTSNILNITLKNHNSAKIDIMNLSGQVIMSKQIENNNNQIDLTNMAAGIYIAQIVSGDQVYTQKVVKK